MTVHAQSALDYRVCPRCHAVFRNPFDRCPSDGEPLEVLGDDPLVGQVLAERYQVESLVGEGGMGRVYRAVHVRTGRPFAIKVIFGEFAADVKARQRFAREAQAASKLDHPNVVPVLDFGELPGGLPYLAMDFVVGVSMYELVRRDGPMQLRRVLQLALQVCDGLRHAHGRGLVHRDFKPENVMVVHDGEREVPRIVDFGLAINPFDASSRLTTGRVMFGTPAYMAPEQARPGHAVDARADLYSLGVSLFEMVTGQLPFDGEVVDVLAAAMAAPRPRMGERLPGVPIPERLEQLVQRMMAIRADDRPASAGEVGEELQAIQDEQGLGRAPTSRPVLAGMRTEPVEATSAAPSRKTLLLAGLALVALGGGGGAFLALRGGGSEPAVAAAADAAPRVVQAPAADAAPLAVVEVAADAGVEPPAEPDAGVAVVGKKPPRPPKHGKPDAGVAVVKKPPPDPDPPDPPPTGEITTEALSARYKSVGALLDRVAKEKGAEAAAPLRKRYGEIPFMDAVRTPALRVDAMRKLAALEKDAKKALAQ